MSNTGNIPLAEQSLAMRRQALMVVLANIGMLTGGMCLGLPTVTLKELTDPNIAVHLTESQASWFASINTLTCPLGGLLSSCLLDQIGRKNTLYVFNIIGLAAWALMAFAIQKNSDEVYIQLLVSRIIVGIATGLMGVPAGVYAAEISLPKIRAILTMGTSISVTSGITLIYLLGYFIRDDWHKLSLICCGYQILALLCIIPMTETPGWLISKGRMVDAKKSLNYFRGQEKSDAIVNADVAAEFELFSNSIQLRAGQVKPSFFKLLRLPEVYKPLLILIGLFSFQQLTGIFVVIVYAVQISTAAGVSIDPFICAVLIGVARLVTVLPMGIIHEKWGRRRSGMISAFGMCVCMFLLAGYSQLKWLQNVPYLPVVTIVSYIIASTFGIYTLPFCMISELFPQKVRGSASGLTMAVGMFIAFLMIKTYPAMKSFISNEFCLFIYGLMAFIAMVFVYLVLPETKGQTLLEIEERFRAGKS